MSAGEPVIEVTPQRLFCPSHGEPLRATWPKGYAIAIQLLQAVFASDELVRAIDPDWDGEAATARMDPEAVNALSAVRPFCYFATEEQLREFYDASGLFEVEGECCVCQQSKDCTRYSCTVPLGEAQLLLCVDCVLVAGAREHEALPDGQNWWRASARLN